MHIVRILYEIICCSYDVVFISQVVSDLGIDELDIKMVDLRLRD